MQRRQFVTSVLATSLVALFSGSPAWAGVEPEPFRTGLFGVTAGQMIRVSVVNAGIIQPCVMPEVLVSAVIIRNLAGAPLFEAKGELLTEGMGMFVDFQPIPDDGAPTPTGALTPGLAPVLPVRSRRLQLRADVVVIPIPDDGVPVPDDGRPACAPVPDDGRPACTPVPDDGRPAGDDALCRVLRTVIPTLEVFDTATGRTVYTMPFVKVAFNPQPEPPEPIRTAN
jgi:hypothetical protein